MRGRSLARRFRGSVRATLCVALPERTGRARVSGRTLGSPNGCSPEATRKGTEPVARSFNTENASS